MTAGIIESTRKKTIALLRFLVRAAMSTGPGCCCCGLQTCVKAQAVFMAATSGANTVRVVVKQMIPDDPESWIFKLKCTTSLGPFIDNMDLILGGFMCVVMCSASCMLYYGVSKKIPCRMRLYMLAAPIYFVCWAIYVLLVGIAAIEYVSPDDNVRGTLIEPGQVGAFMVMALLMILAMSTYFISNTQSLFAIMCAESSYDHFYYMGVMRGGLA